MKLQLRIADFKFSHYFIKCDGLPKMELLFGIDVQKKFSLSYAWDREKNCYIQKEGRFLTYTRNCEQKVNVAVVISALKILPRHNGIIPIKITGHVIKGHMAYFISDQDSRKGKDPNIHIIDGIHNTKGKTYVNVLVSNYTKKHITFNKGEYLGHLEPPIEDTQQIPEDPESLRAHNITTERKMAEKGEPGTFKPTCHKLRKDIEMKLMEPLKEYQSQFVQDETTIGTTPLTKMMIDTKVSEPFSQKPYAIAMKHYKWVKDKINKLLTAKVIWGSQSSWATPIIVVLKADGGKHLVIAYHMLNKITWKFIWPMPKVEDIFAQLNGMKYFSTLDLIAGYHSIPLDESSILKTAFTSPFGKYEYVKVPFGLTQAPAYFQELMTGVFKDFPFTIAFLDDIIIFSST